MSKIRGLSENATSNPGVVEYAGSSKPKSDNRNIRATVASEACGYCGGKAHTDKLKCPANGQKCSKCNKLNHLARVCRSSSNHPQAPHSSSTQGLTSNHQGYQRASAQRNNQKPSGKAYRPNYQVMQVTSETRTDPNSNLQAAAPGRYIDEDDYEEFVRYKASVGFGINAIAPEVGNVNRINQQSNIRVVTKLSGTQVELLVDTGAPINIIDETTYGKLAQEVAVRAVSGQVLRLHVAYANQVSWQVYDGDVLRRQSVSNTIHGRGRRA